MPACTTVPPSMRQVLRVEGEFGPQDAVQLCDADGREFARCLVNMPANELRQVLGSCAWEDPEFEHEELISK